MMASQTVKVSGFLESVISGSTVQSRLILADIG